MTAVEELAAVQAAVVAALGRYIEQTGAVTMDPQTRAASLLRFLRSAGFVIVPAAVPASAPIRTEGWVELDDRYLLLLTRISQGATNGAIGRELWVAEETVKGLVKRLLLGARDRTHAVRRGFELGLLKVGGAS